MAASRAGRNRRRADVGLDDRARARLVVRLERRFTHQGARWPGFLRSRTRLLVLIDGTIQQTTIQSQTTATPDRSDITIVHRLHHLSTSSQMRNSKRRAE